MLEEFINNREIDSIVDKQIEDHYSGPIIIEKGSATSVDWNKYDLSMDEAAKELEEGRNVVAREFEDFGDEDSFPEVDTLQARDYAGMSHDQIVESIRGWYESFGKDIKEPS